MLFIEILELSKDCRNCNSGESMNVNKPERKKQNYKRNLEKSKITKGILKKSKITKLQKEFWSSIFSKCVHAGPLRSLECSC